MSELRASITELQKSVASIQGSLKTLFWGIGIVFVLQATFFAAGKALHWF